MERICVTLPFPPSVNSYWRHPSSGKLAGRHLISEQGRRYRKDVWHWVNSLKLKKLVGPVCVQICAYMPDKRRRDLDNILKACLDSLTHADVWEDDNQVHELTIKKMSKLGGFLIVEITQRKNVESD